MTAVATPSDRVPPATETARLFEAYSEQLLGYCLGQLGSRSEAEDAVQTTFLYALRALRRGIVPECEAAWLTTIAKNVCHSQRRTLHRRGPLASDVDLDTIALAQPGDDEEELLRGLKDALASLPENQRRALVLREWQGVPAREIAGELGMTPTATHALLTRARHSLAHALTVARSPAAALAWLVVDLRAHLKALLPGVSAKAAVAGVAIASVGAGGVVVERTLADPSSPPEAPVADRPLTETGATGASMPVLAPRTVGTPPKPATRTEKIARSRARAAAARNRDGTTRLLVPTLPTAPTRSNQPPADEPSRGDGRPPEPAQPDGPVELPVKPPPLPKAELPQVELPPLPVPPVDPPPIDLDPLPPIDLPPVDLPPVDLPPVDLPPVELPPIELPSLP